MEELRREFDGVSLTQLSPGETFLLELPLEREQVLERIGSNKPIFLRHFQPVDCSRPLSNDADDLAWISDWVRLSRSRLEGMKVGVHVRKADGSPYPYSAADTKAVVDAVLSEGDCELEQQHAEILVAIYASRSTLYVGIGTPAEMLSDWPGGAVRFQREDGQISRAKFKLLEAERELASTMRNFGMRLISALLRADGRPSCWREGLRVTAVDPAELHPSLAAYRTLTVLRKNASEVHFDPDTFDLLVCDMSWSPMGMSKLVLDLVPALKSGGSAIVTIKLMHRKPLQTIRDVKSRLESAFHIRGARAAFSQPGGNDPLHDEKVDHVK